MRVDVLQRRRVEPRRRRQRDADVRVRPDRERRLGGRGGARCGWGYGGAEERPLEHGFGERLQEDGEVGKPCVLLRLWDLRGAGRGVDGGGVDGEKGAR